MAFPVQERTPKLCPTAGLGIKGEPIIVILKAVRKTVPGAVRLRTPFPHRSTRGLTFTGLLIGLGVLCGIAVVVFGLKALVFGRILKTKTNEAIALLKTDNKRAWQKLEYTFELDKVGSHERAKRERARFFETITKDVQTKLASAEGRTESFGLARAALYDFRTFDRAHPNEVKPYQTKIINALHESDKDFASRLYLYSWRQYVSLARELKTEQFWEMDDDTHLKWIKRLEAVDQVPMFSREMQNPYLKDAFQSEKVKGAAALKEAARPLEDVYGKHSQLKQLIDDCNSIQIAGKMTTHTKYRLIIKSMVNCSAFEVMHLYQFDNEIRAGNQSQMEERGTRSVKKGEPLQHAAISTFMGKLQPNIQITRSADYSSDAFGSGGSSSFPYESGSVVRSLYVADIWKKLSQAAKAMPYQQIARDRELELLGAVCQKNLRLAAFKYQGAATKYHPVDQFSSLPASVAWTRGSGMTAEDHAAIEAGSEAWVIF